MPAPRLLVLVLAVVAVAVAPARSQTTAAPSSASEAGGTEYVCATAGSNDVPTQPPLLLTQLLQSNNIAEAKRQAQVPPLLAECCESYSGFFTVNDRYGANMMFWYFPAENNPGSAPLIVWLQGGAGTSMMRPVFVENGPYQSDPTTQTLKKNPGAWTKDHAVLYFDSPIGTGYSYTRESEGLSKNTDEIVENLINAMEQFYVMFAELRGRPLYIAGESYGGKVGTALAWSISRQSTLTLLGFNLKGLIVVNGIVDPINQVDKTDIAYALGMVDEEGRDELRALSTQQIGQAQAGNYSAAVEMSHDVCGGMLSRDITGLTGVSNFLYWRGSPDNGFQEIAEQGCIRSALHVGNATFRARSKLAETALQDLPASVMSKLGELADQMPVLVLNGQLDTCTVYRSLANSLRNMQWQGSDDMKRAQRVQFCVDGQLAGYARTTRSLTHVLVRNAGHLLCQDQPLWVLDIMQRFLRQAPYDTCK